MEQHRYDPQRTQHDFRVFRTELKQSFSEFLCRKASECLVVEAEYCRLFAGSQSNSEDQAKLIVGVVAGLFVAAALVGLIYWLYMKNSRYGKSHLQVPAHLLPVLLF